MWLERDPEKTEYYKAINVLLFEAASPQASDEQVRDLWAAARILVLKVRLFEKKAP